MWIVKASVANQCMTIKFIRSDIEFLRFNLNCNKDECQVNGGARI